MLRYKTIKARMLTNVDFKTSLIYKILIFTKITANEPRANSENRQAKGFIQVV